MRLDKITGISSPPWAKSAMYSWKYQCLILHWRTTRCKLYWGVCFFVKLNTVGPPTQLLLTTATPSHSYGYVKDHTTLAFGWTDSKKWVRDFGTIHLGRSQILHTFWPLPPLPVGSSFTTFCRQISMKLEPSRPTPLQIADVLNGWFLWCSAKKVIICQIGDIFFFFLHWKK